jgi:hypothetical protein
MAKIAYLILTHGQPYQTIDFLWSIWRKEHAYFVHIDAKAPETATAAFAAIATEFSNVRVVPADICTWAGFSLLEAEWRCLMAALATDHEWSHAVLASGTHVPLHRVEELVDSLDLGYSYLDFHPIVLDPSDVETPNVWDQRAERVTFEYVEVPGIGVMRGLTRSVPDGVTFYLGSQWWILSREAAEFVCASREDPLAEFFRSSLVPDELCIHTILLNSALKPRITQRNLVWQRWQNGRPKALSELDLATAFSSGQQFARKASEPMMRDHSGILSKALATTDRGTWVRQVTRAFANFLPAAMRDTLIEGYRFGRERQVGSSSKADFVTRSLIREATAHISRSAEERGMSVQFWETASEENQPTLVCRFPNLGTSADYLLVTRISNRRSLWVGLYLHASQIDNARDELSLFPEPHTIDLSFPLAGTLHPHHDFLSLDMKRLGVIRLDADASAVDLESAIRTYLRILAAIPKKIAIEAEEG